MSGGEIGDSCWWLHTGGLSRSASRSGFVLLIRDLDRVGTTPLCNVTKGTYSSQGQVRTTPGVEVGGGGGGGGLFHPAHSSPPFQTQVHQSNRSWCLFLIHLTVQTHAPAFFY